MNRTLSSPRRRIVVAGCGGMAHTWVEYALTRDDADIVGLVDVRLEAAEGMRDKHGLSCGVYTDLEQAIAESGADLVFDVTIPASHHVISQTAMRLGCDVFTEKPLAESWEACLDVVRTASETGRMHAVMQNRRFDPRIRAFRKLIAGGAIGTPGFAGADFFIGAHFGGFRDLMDSPLILDMAIHTFDQARLLLGADPVSVYCQEFNPPGSWYKGAASALCIFEMSDGSVFSYRGSWCSEGAPTSWEAQWRVIGSTGTALWDGEGSPYAEVVDPAGQEQAFIRSSQRIDTSPDEAGEPWHHRCIAEMFDALHGGRPSETDCRDNLLSMAMVFGAIRSSAEGRKVAISELLPSGSLG
ncbi:Gfo/Idh/MocA family protein [Paenibacillus pasadenensis]|uniref:Small Molecule Metabolism n=1 Tax=Paenibacillus pasadenensis TaxID=217090 RepID=A0A2N5N6F2_9BACL|nr:MULTISPECIES: Gfo/Idh/MocA family oxidoreductase [Paenibacillus]PLT45912.1 Small Molecule Metabolism [Paenibacillus pasadenensis]QGG56327.1 gfo/Idh/MocA family oxidoreductase [Paenibacillus sp. B01]